MGSEREWFERGLKRATILPPACNPAATAFAKSCMSPKPIEIGDGQTFLVIVRDDQVLDYTWAMMPHVEFVRRTVGKLPDDAWVGTVSKIGEEIATISSKTFYGYQLPAPEWVARTIQLVFK